MTIDMFLKNQDLQDSLLLGYYGGGNFGDELLLEVLQSRLAAQGVTRAEIAYMPYAPYERFHHDFGYSHFRANSVIHLLRAMDRNRRIIVGGGGIWGLDAVLQVFLMSVALFIARWLFGKQVYLVGVGYYSSTNLLGHISAFIAAISSTHIIGRDKETVENFGRFTKRVSQDKDMAWYMQQLETTPYAEALGALEAELPISQPTLLITIRRFSDKHQNNYTQLVEQALAKFPNRQAIVMMLEPKTVDPEGYTTLQQWQARFPHIRIADFHFNPIAFYMFLQKHRKQLTMISPQFHAILCAHLAGVPFLPLVYDNKSLHLLHSMGVQDTQSIYKLGSETIEQFIEAAA